jgi:hypothetical protein
MDEVQQLSIHKHFELCKFFLLFIHLVSTIILDILELTVSDLNNDVLVMCVQFLIDV